MRLFERLFVVLLFLSSMGVVDALTRPSLGENTPEGITTDVPLPTVIAETGIYFVGFVLVSMRLRNVLNAARSSWPLVAFTALAPISIAWSTQPMLTLRRSALVIGSTVIAIYLGERYSTSELAKLLAQALCVMMLIVLALSFLQPTLVIDYGAHFGDWKGLSGHKNAFGAYMAIALIVLGLVRFRRFQKLRWIFLLTAVGFLVLSRSLTALLGCLLVMVAMPLWRSTRLNSRTKLIVSTAAVLAFFLVIYMPVSNTDTFFRLLGRDSSLSGRANLWAALTPAISNRPILGYGYGAFWGALRGETLSVLIRSGWLPTAADNGYIDLVLSLGLIGFFSFFCLFGYCIRKAYAFLLTEPGPVGLWPLAYLSFFAIHAFFESQLFATRSLEFLLFASVTTSLAVHDRKQRLLKVGAIRPALVDAWEIPVSVRGPRPSITSTR